MLEINKPGFIPGDDLIDGPKILQRADVVWSTLKIEKDEVLLIKVSKHLSDHVMDIKSLIDHVFKKEGDRVIMFIEGDIEFTKVTRL